MRKDKNKDIIVFSLIVLGLLIVTVVVALIVVNTDAASNASYDAWLPIIGSISGSFIGAMAIFTILHMNRKDIFEIRKSDKSDKIEDDEKEKKVNQQE